MTEPVLASCRLPRHSESVVALRTPRGESLGVLAHPHPEVAAAHTGVLILSGGAQVRAGSHRQFVSWARHLASHGVATLRFDWPGLGDAPGAPPAFEHLSPDTDAAIAALLAAQPQLSRVVLVGLCDGASAALLHLDACHDARVSGLCLINPWVRSEQSLARTHVQHYYGQRLLQPDFWRKVLSGGVGLGAAKELLRNLRRSRRAAAAPALSFQHRMAQAWRHFAGPILLLVSEQDITGQEFMDAASTDTAWSGCLQQPHVTVMRLPGADHTCSDEVSHQALMQHLNAWLQANR